MRHFFSTRVRVVLILAVLLALALGIISGLTNISIPDMVVKTVLTPIRTGIRRLADGAEQVYDYIFEYEALLAENQKLKEELAAMEEDALRADSLIRELERLRSLLGLKEANEDFKLVDGYIISWSSGDWTSTFTINTGANVGIQPRMCAITANGEVVGIVDEVGPNYAVVKTVLDSSLTIRGTIASSSSHKGMVRGGYATGQEGLLRMDYLDSSAVIRNNDQVVTAGSIDYPRNLILGHVVDADFDETGVAKFALLKPAADFDALEQVFIITEYTTG